MTFDGSRSLPSAHRISCEGTMLLRTGTMTEFVPSEQGQNCIVDCEIFGHTACSDDLLTWFSAYIVIDRSSVAQIPGKVAKQNLEIGLENARTESTQRGNA